MQLSDITSIIGDGLHGTPEYDLNGDYYFINGNNLIDRHVILKENTKTVNHTEFEKYKKPLNENTILVSINGTIGNVGLYNNEKVVLGKSVCFFNLLHCLNKEYLCLFIESDYFQKYALSSATGSTIKNVPLKAMNELLVPIPSVEEQERIVKTVYQWFQIIDILEINKKDLEERVKIAMSKILDLAIHGKLVPQDPNDEPAIELLKRINPKFTPCDNAQYENVPSNWAVCKVKDVFRINPKTKAEDGIDAGFIPMSNIQDSFNNSISFEPRTWGSIKKGYTHFEDGDIVVAKISPCLENRKSAVIVGLPNGIGAGTTELNVFRSDFVNHLYGLFFFKSDYFISQCVGTFNGVVGQQRVATKIIEDMEFPVPPRPEQERIVNKVNELFQILDDISAVL